MPTRYREESFTVDNDFFADAIVSQLTEGKSAFSSPTVNDLISFYGSVSAVSKALVGEGAYKSVDSARKQIQRMRNNPNLKLTPKTQDKIASINIENVPNAMISIIGNFTYDGTRWSYGAFDYTPTQNEMKSIIYAARPSNPNRNQDSLNAFMDAYGVGVYFQFSTGSEVVITEL